jgi:hypothetical protein
MPSPATSPATTRAWTAWKTAQDAVSHTAHTRTLFRPAETQNKTNGHDVVASFVQIYAVSDDR